MSKSFRLGVMVCLLLLLAACQTTTKFQNARLSPSDRQVDTVKGFLTKPDGAGPFPAVVLLHACGGVMQHINAGWPDYLNRLGYAVLAVDTFGSRGHGICPNPISHDAFNFVKDAYGALDHLAEYPFVDANRVAVMGFSVGADHINNALIPWRLRTTGERDFKAAVAFYGRCHRIGPYPEGSVPLMEIVAEMDKNTYSSACEPAGRQNPRIEVHVIAGAYHAFDSREYSGKLDGANNKMQYSEKATEKARELTRLFLGRHLESPGR